MFKRIIHVFSKTANQNAEPSESNQDVLSTHDHGWWMNGFVDYRYEQNEKSQIRKQLSNLTQSNLHTAALLELMRNQSTRLY